MFSHHSEMASSWHRELQQDIMQWGEHRILNEMSPSNSSLQNSEIIEEDAEGVGMTRNGGHQENKVV